MSARARMPLVGLLATLLVGSLLSACASVPSSGNVETIELGSNAQQKDPMQVRAPTPKPGFTPEQTVRGFLEAMASEQPGYLNAKLFLSSRIQDSWRPKRTTIIDNLEPPTAQDGTIVLEADRVAKISEDGSWTSASGSFKQEFELVKEGRTWRIAEPPDTLLLSRFDFDRLFAPYNLYFFDQNSEILVPDPVYLPKGKGIETRLVNALLTGSSRWLRPAVHSALPKGLRLAGSAVTVKNHVATIDLHESVLELDKRELWRGAAQLAWTLHQVGVASVRITVKGVPVPIGGGATVARPIRLDPALYGAIRQPYAVDDEGRVVLVTPASGLVPVKGLDGPEARSPRSIAPGMRSTARQSDEDSSSSRSERFALVSHEGTELWLYAGRQAPREPVYEGKNLAGLSWDRTGKLWFVDRTPGDGELLVIDELGKLRRVAIPGVPPEQIQGLRISRDGVRMAILLKDADRTSLAIGRIDRSGRLAVRDLRRISVPLQTMTDLAWSGVTQLTVIGRTTAERTKVLQVSVDGSTMNELTNPPEGTAIAAAPEQPVLVAGTPGNLEDSDKRLLAHDLEKGVGWQSRGHARLPAYPG